MGYSKNGSFPLSQGNGLYATLTIFLVSILKMNRKGVLPGKREQKLQETEGNSTDLGGSRTWS